MAKRLLKTLLLPILALAMIFVFAACDSDEIPGVTYTVTYVIGEDAQGTAPTETDKAINEKFIIKSADGITNGDKEFTGWSDGSIIYQPGDEYTMPIKAVVFTAQWKDEEKPSEGEEKPSEGEEKPGEGEEKPSEGEEKPGEGEEKPDPDHTVYSAVELNDKGYIFLYDDNTGILEYLPDTVGADARQVKLTYTLSGTSIAITIGDSTFNGTYAANGENKLLTVNITYLSVVYKFGKAEVQPTGKPVISFDANGGSGSAPVIADADIALVGSNYKITLPKNTYTAPLGKAFDGWCVNGTTDANGKEVAHKSASYIANAGEKITLKALWRDAAEDEPTGTEYFGNCHIVDESPLTPVNVYVKAIMFDVEKGTMYYRIDDSLTYKKSRSVINQDSDSDKPSDYGANAKFYEVIIEGKAVKLLLDVDNKLKLYDTNYKAYDNGEFSVLNTELPDTTEYTVTFDPNNGENSWTVKVAAGGTVAKPSNAPVNSSGKAFRYWKNDDTGAEYTFSSAVTGNLDLTAVYAWKVTYSAGENAAGTIDPVWVSQWTVQGVILPGASDLSNGSKVFAGWWDGTYDEEDPTVKNIYSANERYVGTGNVNFVAQWKVDNTYTVGFVKAVKYGDRSKVQGADPDIPNRMEAGATFAAPANTYTLAGCEFDGWELREFSADTTLGAKLGDYAVGDTITMPAKPVQLVAKWKEIKTTATVTYKAGAHGIGVDVVKNNVAFNSKYQLVNYLSSFTANNYYTFVGWKVEGDNSDALWGTNDENNKYNLTDDTVFVAQYANAYSGYDNDFTVGINLFFDKADGTLVIFSEDEEAEPEYVNLTVSTSGNNITITPEGGTACIGTFVNNVLNIALTASGTTYTFGDPDAGNTKYTVTYVLGEGATGTLPTETDKAAGDKFNLAVKTGLANGDKEFDGWSDGTTKYAAGAEYTMPNINVTFTAVWKSNAPIVWDAISTKSGALFDAVNSKGSAIYLFDEEFTIGRFTFVGIYFETAGAQGDKYLCASAIYYTDNVKSSMKYNTPTIIGNDKDSTTINFYKYNAQSSTVTYSYDVRTSGGSYYVTAFTYSNTSLSGDVQIQLTYTNKTIDELKAQ